MDRDQDALSGAGWSVMKKGKHVLLHNLSQSALKGFSAEPGRRGGVAHLSVLLLPPLLTVFLLLFLCGTLAMRRMLIASLVGLLIVLLIVGIREHNDAVLLAERRRGPSRGGRPSSSRSLLLDSGLPISSRHPGLMGSSSRSRSSRSGGQGILLLLLLRRLLLLHHRRLHFNGESHRHHPRQWSQIVCRLLLLDFFCRCCSPFGALRKG